MYIPPSTPRELWIATQFGLVSRFEMDIGTFTNYPGDRLGGAWTMLEDSSGRFWIGSSNGLALFDRSTEEYTWFTEEEGLVQNLVWSILEDDRGFLWLGTNNGMSRFDPETQTFKNFTTKDDLPSNRFEESGFFKSSTGELFFKTRGETG